VFVLEEEEEEEMEEGAGDPNRREKVERYCWGEMEPFWKSVERRRKSAKLSPSPAKSCFMSFTRALFRLSFSSFSVGTGLTNGGREG